MLVWGGVWKNVAVAQETCYIIKEHDNLRGIEMSRLHYIVSFVSKSYPTSGGAIALFKSIQDNLTEVVIEDTYAEGKIQQYDVGVYYHSSTKTYSVDVIIVDDENGLSVTEKQINEARRQIPWKTELYIYDWYDGVDRP